MNTIQNSETDTRHLTDLRLAKIPLNFGSGAIPALGFGTLIPDPVETKRATTDALRAGFRHFDCAERYRNEREVGESLRAEFAAGKIAREDVFITTKLWNTNHRPERVEPAFDASCERLGIRYVDLYLIHTPFAFQPGDNYDPRDQKGDIIYDIMAGDDEECDHSEQAHGPQRKYHEPRMILAGARVNSDAS